MRSNSEIDRDFAGMKDNCQLKSHGCDYPNCPCSRKGAIPIPKKVYKTCPTCGGCGEVAAAGPGMEGQKQ
jgi:hypothetical protein